MKGRKTGGRQKGTPNRATAARVAEIAASGLTPLDYMLRVMRDDEAPKKRRDDMAKAAAPYVHPRLAALGHSGKDWAPVVVEIIRFSDDGNNTSEPVASSSSNP